VVLLQSCRDMSTPLIKESGADSKPAASELWQEAIASLSPNERDQVNASNKWEQGSLEEVSCSTFGAYAEEAN
jgi:hypothetical protein